MEFWVARAMQIACLDEEQLGHIHRTEEHLQYPHCLANFNIQDILGIGTIKEHWGIPEDDLEAQSRHAQRIERELRTKKFVPCESGWPGEANCEATHEMDWKIVRLRDQIPWEFQGGRKFQGSLKSRLKRQNDDAE